MTAEPAPAQPLPLHERLDALLPQTQCTRCGYIDCAAYARAMADGQAPCNQCPPGGEAGIQRLSAALGVTPLPLNPAHGVAGPRHVAWIDESRCIGCTLCIQACPVDCIVGGNKHMHVVMEARCTGCELCVPACPVDCIHLEVLTPGQQGWDAWSPDLAQAARAHYAQRQSRLKQQAKDKLVRQAAKASHKVADEHIPAAPPSPQGDAKRKAMIEAAMAAARARLAQTPTKK